VWSAAPGERSEVRVDFDTTPIETALNWGGVYLNGAYFSHASDALRQQTDPLEPAGRRFANFFLVLHRALPDLQRMKLC